MITTPSLNKLLITRINGKELKKFRYDANKVNFNYKRIKSFFTYEENRLENLSREMRSILQAFIMNLIFMISDKDIPDNEFNKSYKKKESEFIQALVNDKKFVDHAKSLVDDFDQSFKKMMNMIN